MKQPLIAPATMGASIVAGVAAILVGGYKIADCLRYQAGPGACDQAVETNAVTIVGGIAAVAGPIGGLFTYNEKLEAPGSSRRRRRWSDELGSEPEPPALLPGPPDLAVIDQDPRVTRLSEAEAALSQAFQEMIAEGVIPSAKAPPPLQPPEPKAEDLKDPWLDDERIDETIKRLEKEGWTQQGIADHLDVTLYRVRKALGKL
jgi:hypothetical protein